MFNLGVYVDYCLGYGDVVGGGDLDVFAIAFHQSYLMTIALHY